MTEKQRQLVADNHNLIFSFLHKHGFDEEEFYDLAAIGLCKAAKNYNDDVSKFSTYAYRCMLNTILNELKTKNVGKRIPEELIESYNNQILCKDGELMEVVDILPCGVDLEREAITRMMIDKCMRSLSDRNRLIFALLLDGYTYREIGEIISCHHSYVGRIKSKIVSMMGEM